MKSIELRNEFKISNFTFTQKFIDFKRVLNFQKCNLPANPL